MEYKNSQIQIIRKEIPNYKNFFTFSTDNTGLWRDRFFLVHTHTAVLGQKLYYYNFQQCIEMSFFVKIINVESRSFF